MRYDDDIYLYTSNHDSLELNDLPAYLQHRFNLNIPVVLYVHGRGKEPKKSLKKKKIVRRIETNFGVECLMFSWDSKAGGFLFGRIFDRERPLKKTARGAEKFAQVLTMIAGMNAREGKLSLLVHSMGNIVLQKVVQGNTWPNSARIFNNVLMSEPDADAQGHAVWLQELALREQVFVTINSADNTLKHAGDGRRNGETPLGLGRSGENAVAANYLDLSGLVDKAHRVFAKASMNSQVAVCNVISQILRGDAAPLTAADIAVSNGNLHQLRNDRQPDNPIFNNIGMADEDENDEDDFD